MVVNADGVAKLCDFGMMERQGQIAVHGSGTTPYMAPEALAMKVCGTFLCFVTLCLTYYHLQGSQIVADKMHDIWSLGVLLFVLLTGDFPWLKAAPTDADYNAFLRGNVARDPWNRLSSQCLTVCCIIMMLPIILELISSFSIAAAIHDGPSTHALHDR